MRSVFSLVTLLVASFAQAADRPNVIAVVTDDQARWALGCYGNKQVHTPYMDKLAREGARFLNAFTNTPVCSPSRATYLSGRYPTEVKITDWISNPEAKAGVGLRAPTWPQALQKAGYRTGLVGKWHLGENPEYHPTKLGFDHFMGFLDGGNTPMDPMLEVEGVNARRKGYIEDLIFEDAIQFIRKPGDQPYALCIHSRAPHLLYGPVREEDSAHYKGADPTVPELPGIVVEKLKKSTLEYYASISSVDRNLGRLLDALEQSGKSSNTLVIFTSDHGYNEGRHLVDTKGNGSWIAGGVRGPMRPNMWDTSIRIPLLMRWPAVIKPGTEVHEMVSNIDMYRSIVGAAGIPLPQSDAIRGVDFSPLLRGQSITSNKSVFGQYDLHNYGLAYMRMIRTDRHKLVRFFHAKNIDELYDLTADPDEKRNLLAGPKAQPRSREIAAELGAQLLEWMKSVNDPLLTDPY